MTQETGETAGLSPDCSSPAARGRPRSEAASQAILSAVLDLIAERGSLGDVSVDAVAELSGVSKATIYRRWSSKEELVATAVDSIKSTPEVELSHTSVREDLIRLGRNIRSGFTEKERRVLKSMVLESSSNPDFKRHHDRFIERRRAVVREVFWLGVERGELRGDIDLDLAVAMFVSPLLTIIVYQNYPDLHTDGLVERIVDHLLYGFARRD
ncbi:TetR/AcrR family transcriptional regulator [Hoyosella sp. YIM 151337]|uniref:TetR/AcrR family transcriptional regulator n=1 Tax=Hoyosella sp. YIM 151337 TaxID=2992742 RepID=UPI002236B59E|nr:TetR/AcrR family transcriptional regulator [Hoyosella sp. YIM 151337]MCW4355556.1 TetR/AcrR family transcriptional regulator [Hoyosella sp. YIM 151337]